MKKCNYCGREGTAPDVRGTKSVAVQIGNYRMNVECDLTICETCADRFMSGALDSLVVELFGKTRGGGVLLLSTTTSAPSTTSSSTR